MNKISFPHSKTLGLSIAFVLLGACSAATVKPDGADHVRQKLSQLQADPHLSSRAPVAIKEAEVATRTAELPEKNKSIAAHRVYIADHKVDIATALAQSRYLEDQRKGLQEERDLARLNARTREADRAHKSATVASEEAERARAEMMLSQKRNAELEQELVDLNAKKTKRGMVLTLGDILFESGQSELKGGSVNNLDKLSVFLNENQDRQLVIEGYTDNVGSDEYNLGLSQRRAEAVQVYLMKKGVANNRMTVLGKGETVPVASNDSGLGRQQNRRVEVILPDIAS